MNNTIVANINITDDEIKQYNQKTGTWELLGYTIKAHNELASICESAITQNEDYLKELEAAGLRKKPLTTDEMFQQIMEKQNEQDKKIETFSSRLSTLEKDLGGSDGI